MVVNFPDVELRQASDLKCLVGEFYWVTDGATAGAAHREFCMCSLQRTESFACVCV